MSPICQLRRGVAKRRVAAEIGTRQRDARWFHDHVPFAQNARLHAAARSATVVDHAVLVLLDHEVVPDRRDAGVELDWSLTSASRVVGDATSTTIMGSAGHEPNRQTGHQLMARLGDRHAGSAAHEVVVMDRSSAREDSTQRRLLEGSRSGAATVAHDGVNCGTGLMSCDQPPPALICAAQNPRPRSAAPSISHDGRGLKRLTRKSTKARTLGERWRA